MRLSELLRSEVVAADGQPLGRVVDVRVVQDGPLLESFGAALRIEALIVGRGGIGVRLGYGRKGMRGPWLLARIFQALEHRAHLVPIEEVDSMETGTVRLKLAADDVQQLRDI